MRQGRNVALAHLNDCRPLRALKNALREDGMLRRPVRTRMQSNRYVLKLVARRRKTDEHMLRHLLNEPSASMLTLNGYLYMMNLSHRLGLGFSATFVPEKTEVATTVTQPAPTAG